MTEVNLPNIGPVVQFSEAENNLRLRTFNVRKNVETALKRLGIPIIDTGQFYIPPFSADIGIVVNGCHYSVSITERETAQARKEDDDEK